MTLNDYLLKTREIADEEVDVLNELQSKRAMSPIEFRAAKSALQVLTENCIGKAKRILKYYECPTIPQQGRDAIRFLYEIGLIEDDTYEAIHGAIGLRNAMIHDYMTFNKTILERVVKEKKYEILHQFLIEDVNYSNLKIQRIQNFYL
jgi:uncharacterized protein YutE (UPF0331/DUF86 family)